MELIIYIVIKRIIMNEKIGNFCKIFKGEYDGENGKENLWFNPFERNNILPTSDLLFDKDWNWIMFVVEKIEKMNNCSEDNEFDIFGKCVQLGEKEYVGDNKFDATLKAVIDYIDNNVL